MTHDGKTSPGSLAVFDLGKTNSKLFVFSAEGKILSETRTKPIWRLEGDVRVLDDDYLYTWMQRSLAAAIVENDVTRVTFSGHGCTFALIENDRLAHPILDYEQEPPSEIGRRIDAFIPPFNETFSPELPLGFNYGRHILWLQDRNPGLLEKTDSILSYPQFWSWKFSGRKVSEVSYLGCHSHLWAPLENDFSSLVEGQRWRTKMPAMVRSGVALGSTHISLSDGTLSKVVVHNGVHDSNAALYFYRSVGFDDFTLVSTGTWVIIFNSACSLSALDERRDMLANVTVDHQPAPTIRFMEGREYDVVSGGWTRAVSMAAIESVVAKHAFALPSFAQGGPFPGARGLFIGPQVEGEERAAAALLYVTLMTDLSLDLIQSENPIVIDGGLVKTGHYASLLAELRPKQQVFTSGNAEGSAFGAAALVFEQTGQSPFQNQCSVVKASEIPRLAEYRDRWRHQVERLGLPEERDSEVRGVIA